MKKIKSIEVTNSPFFEDIKIQFSEKLNCIMGGRGTGKSTLLYFLKAAVFQDAENDKTIYDILKENLGSGEVKVEIDEEDGNSYLITKTFNDEPQPYKLPAAEFIPIEKIFEGIECDFYETGKIENIGRSKKERLDLIDKKIKANIKNHEKNIFQIQIDLDANAQDIKSFNKRIAQVDKFLLQYEDIENDLEAHKKSQPDSLKDSEKKEFEEADYKEKIRKEEKRFLNKIFELFSELKNELESISFEAGANFDSAIEEKESFINKDILDPALKEAQKSLVSVQQNLKVALQSIEISSSKLEDYHVRLSDKHDLQQAEFIKIKQKFETNREYINKYHSLSKKLNEKKNLIKDKKELTSKREKLKRQRKSLINKLNDLKQNIFKARLGAIKELNKLFDGLILINLTHAGITDDFEDKLREALKGSGLRYNELIQRIVEHFSTDEFAEIIQSKSIEKLKDITGIDEARSNALIDALYESEEIYEIEGMYCNDLPEFKLRIHEGEFKDDNYRKSDELSMGQRCTTVLPIIFAVSDNPLIIDQPEDNLDNKYITDQIHKIIREQKVNRQLIFITHNPNIPVLSESEHNIFLNFDRKANIEKLGNIEEVRTEIIKLLEGGQEAFERRMKTYGY